MFSEVITDRVSWCVARLRICHYKSMLRLMQNGYLITCLITCRLGKKPVAKYQRLKNRLAYGEVEV